MAMLLFMNLTMTSFIIVFSLRADENYKCYQDDEKPDPFFSNLYFQYIVLQAPNILL